MKRAGVCEMSFHLVQLLPSFQDQVERLQACAYQDHIKMLNEPGPNQQCNQKLYLCLVHCCNECGLCCKALRLTWHGLGSWQGCQKSRICAARIPTAQQSRSRPPLGTESQRGWSGHPESNSLLYLQTQICSSFTEFQTTWNTHLGKLQQSS